MTKQNKLPVALVDEENGPTVIARYKTVEEAEKAIEKLELYQQEKVHRGGFGIDAPEEMINPFMA